MHVTVRQVILNNLYKHTALQSRFACNMVALVDSTPQSLSLKDFLQHFLDFRCARLAEPASASGHHVQAVSVLPISGLPKCTARHLAS